MSNVRSRQFFFRPLESIDASSIVVWQRNKSLLKVAFKCYSCGGTGIRNMKIEMRTAKTCPECGGSGWFGVTGEHTTSLPGSDGRLVVMQHRYAHKLPLWHDKDGTDSQRGMKWGEYPKPVRQKGKGEKASADYKIRKRCIKLRMTAGLEKAEEFMHWAMGRMRDRQPEPKLPEAATTPAPESAERAPS